MNKHDRKHLSSIITKIELAGYDLEQLIALERDKFEAMPEGLQCSEKGQSIEDAAEAMEAALDQLNDICSELGEYAS